MAPSERERTVRTGGVVELRLVLKASRGGDLRVSHLWTPPAGMSCDAPPDRASSEKTPCTRLRGGLPDLSRGFMGTMPSLPFWRTKTAVEAR